MTASPTGNGNNNWGLGAGNTTATVLGNDNRNTALGALNQAVTVGTPEIAANVVNVPQCHRHRYR